MKALALIIAASLATGALAQQTVRGNASAESQASVSADRQGADVAINATLERSIDARRAQPGDEVTAKANEGFTMANGTTIPRGSRLVGRVTEARAHARGENAAASQLGIVFDRADLPDGRVVPMQATIQAVAAARSQAHGELGSASHGASAFGSSHASGGGHAGGLGSAAIGGVGSAAGAIGATSGGVLGSAGGGTVGGPTRLPRPSAGAVGGLNASGQWLAGSRGVFGIGDLELASAAAGGAHGSLITSPSRNVRLDGGTQLLLVGGAAAGR